MKIEDKSKGITLLAIETLSLAMAIVSNNNMNTTCEQLTNSEEAANLWSDNHNNGIANNIPWSNVNGQYLSDHDAYQSAKIQFYGAAISSLAVWAYNIYDVRKKRYNYTDTQQNSRFGFSFTKDNQAIFHIKF